MAKVIFSQLVDKVVNKAGESVFTSNRFGPVVRKRVKPINPRSAAQTAQRNLLKELSQGWKGLSQAEITGWNSLAKQITKKDKLGRAYNPTGEELYIGVNINIMNNGGAGFITTPPSISANTVANLASFGFATVAGVLTVTWTNSALATAIVELRSSGIISAGKTFQSKFKTFYHVACNAAPVSADISAAYVAQFGATPNTSQVTFVEYRVVDKSTGFASLYPKDKGRRYLIHLKPIIPPSLLALSGRAFLAFNL